MDYFVNWLATNYGYKTIVILKALVGIGAGTFLGFLLGVLVIVWCVKHTRTDDSLTQFFSVRVDNGTGRKILYVNLERDMRVLLYTAAIVLLTLTIRSKKLDYTLYEQKRIYRNAKTLTWSLIVIMTITLIVGSLISFSAILPYPTETPGEIIFRYRSIFQDWH